MSIAVRSPFALDDSFVRELEGLYVPWQGAEVPERRLLVLNEELSGELGLDVEAVRRSADVLAGHAAPEGATTVAQAYAGHQFGMYSPRLGDGRALLLGELLDAEGRRRDLHLKGSGRTPFARGADGKAVVGPMLREYVIGEAMHALGIPTSRALAVVATGERIRREAMLPGAVLARVAASHLRVGTFQFAAANGGPPLVRRLADYSIARHHPDSDSYLDFYERVIDAQASLVARWMLVGFIHGVMNTDNMTISGETIDYGPCAFMDAYDPRTVFSSIDHGGRYAYGNQPAVAAWNLARLAEAMLPLFDDDQDTAVAEATRRVEAFTDRFEAYWRTGMCAKLGVRAEGEITDALLKDFLALLERNRLDYTSSFRALSASLRGGEAPAAFGGWIERWRAELAGEPAEVAAAMDRVNPVYIPRNQQVEAALTAATAGDMEPFHWLLDVVARPYDERPGLEAYAAPGRGPFVTYCGT